jgi:hypothetical protein
VTFKGNKSKTERIALGVTYELNRTETRAADYYCEAQFDNAGSKKHRIGGLPKDRYSDHYGQI